MTVDDRTPETAGPAGEHRHQRFFLYAVLLFPFLIANARMLKSIPGYSYVCLFASVKTITLIIPFIVIVVYYYFRYGRKESSIAGPAGLITMVLLCSFAGLFSGSTVNEVIQGLYQLLVPILIAQTVLGFDRWDVRTEEVIRFLLIIAALNVLPALYIYVNFGLGGDVYFNFRGYRVNRFDVVNGLFSDSHQFSIYFSMMSLLVIGFLKRTRTTLLMAAGLFGVGFLGYNAKALLVFILLFAAAGVVMLYERRKALVLVVGSLTVLLSTVLFSVAVEYDNRIELFTNIRLQDAPVINPIVKAADVFVQNPDVALFGAGFGNYGSTIAIARANANGAMHPLARTYNGYSIWAMTSQESAASKSGEFISFLSFNINTMTSTVVEIGLIASVIFLSWYGRIVRYFVRSYRRNDGHREKDRVIVIYCAFVLINSLLVLWGSFDDEVAVVPILILAATEMRNRTAAVRTS